MARPGYEYIKPTIRQRPPIRPFKVNPAFHRLQWNESPFDFPAELKEEVLQRLANTPWSRYPLGFRAVDLLDAVAKYYNLSSDQVVVGNGSSDLLRIVINAVLGPGDHMVTLAPTFGMYKGNAELLGAEVHEVTLDPELDFALPVDEIIHTTVEQKAKLVVICAPNNPTGTPFELDDIQRIVRSIDALVIVDEAYAEFSDQHFLPLIQASDNVVLIHTLSKAFASAGARVGYALTNAAIAGELQKLVNTFTLSPFSEAVAEVALEHADAFKPIIAQIVAERERLARALATLRGVRVFPSATNFLLVHLGRPAKEAHAYLIQHHHMLVTDMGMYPGYGDYLRISVGSPEQNDLLIVGMREFLSASTT